MSYFTNFDTQRPFKITAFVLSILVVGQMFFGALAVLADEAGSTPVAETTPIAEPVVPTTDIETTPLSEPAVMEEPLATSEPLILSETESEDLSVTDSPLSAVEELTTEESLPPVEEILVIPASTPSAPSQNNLPLLGSLPPVPVCVPNIEAVYTLPNTSESIILDMESTPLIGPRLLAYWTMSAEQDDHGVYLGSDDEALAGAQFLPSGQYEVNKNLAVCAVVINGSGLGNLASVSATINYPDNMTVTTAGSDNCGAPFGEPLAMTIIPKDQTIELLCEKIKNNNNNLPILGHGVNFETLCGPTGKINSDIAALYCAETTLSYSSPAGNYQVKISALDLEGHESPVLVSDFKYLELTAYSVDFNNVSYGAVQPHTPKLILGDLDWQPEVGQNSATVRNVGNTRLRLVVRQNDFGLGKTFDNWNVQYSARVGHDNLVSYFPDESITLPTVLELGGVNSLDFGIEVFEFPTVMGSYAGEMTIATEKVEYLSCSQ